MPSSADLALPSSILASSETPPEAGIEVVISREKVLVNGVQIKGLEVPNCFNSAAEGPKPTEPYRLFFCPGDSSSGFATKYKSRGTKQDLEISPLLNAVRDPVLIAEENSKRQNKGVATVEARIFFDRYTSFRVMTEVLFTLGLAKVSKFHFIAMKESK